jgi:DNA (cytosine-5)-methyltransferase 1
VPDLHAIDVFAGPGGWDEGVLELGIRPLGVEWDDAACATRTAAGHRTLQADVSELDPHELVPAGEHVDLLIGSPPCPTFSAAGGGSGHVVVDVILECLDALRDGRDERDAAREKAYEALLPDAIAEEQERAKKKNRAFLLERAEQKARRNAAMSLLVVEPFRYALELRPRWIALEQVPPVLPIWERVAADLREHGWYVWTGLLSSERFGVPQTRERAILLADLDRPVAAPRPTHQRYVPPRREDTDAERLFDPGRRERIVERGEEHLIPWVSMAEALGWGMNARPCITVVGGQGRDESRGGARNPLRGGSGSAQTMQDAKESGDWSDEERPAKTLCGHHTPRWLYDGDQETEEPPERISVLTRGEDGSRPNDIFDATERPSRALTGRAYSLIAEGVEAETRPQMVRTSFGEPHRGPDAGSPSPEFDPEQRPSRTIVGKTADWELVNGSQDHATHRSPDEPAPTIAFGHAAADVAWVQRERSGDRSEEGFDPAASPAQALTSKARSWRVRNYHGGDDGKSHASGGPVSPTFDPEERPVRTLTHRVGGWEVEVDEGTDPPTEEEVEMVVRTGQNSTVSRDPAAEPVPYERDIGRWTVNTGRAWKEGDTREDAQTLDASEQPAPAVTAKSGGQWHLDRPAPTIVGTRRSKDGMLAGRQLPPGEGENVGGWGYERPATTLAGDARAFSPGGHIANDGRDNEKMLGRSENAVRLSVPEASILQGFRSDYPWQGSRTAQFTQVGNAVPPPMARACVWALIEP